MPKVQNSGENDLFGRPIRKRPNRYEKALARIDKESFDNRVERLKYIDGILGDIMMVGSIEAFYVFREAGWAYINGEYISTIMLSQSFIEIIFHDFLVDKGFENVANLGAAGIIECCRNNQLVNTFLLDKFDRLRQIRNPFVHHKTFDRPYTLNQRLIYEQIPPEILLEKDAKEAISLMYTFLLTRM